MPFRKTILATNEIYHVFNRGVASMPIFKSVSYFKRFISLLQFYRFSSIPISYSQYIHLNHYDRQNLLIKIENSAPLIELYAFCLMSNHFHLLLRQLQDNGISKYLSNMQNAHSKYFNLKNDRHGPMFQSRFKAVRVATDAVFLHVSRYIHLNPVTEFIVEINKLVEYEWSSYPLYVKNQNSSFIQINKILDLIGGKDKYMQFIYNQADYQRKLGMIKHLTLE